MTVGKLPWLASNLLKRTKHNAFNTLGRYATKSSNDYNIEVDTSTGVAVATMTKKPVNSFSLEFLQNFTSSISELESNGKVRGLIITSGIPKIFSGGLDIMEMYNVKAERTSEFWKSVQEFWMKIYISPLVTIAAINGNSPAGGCLLASSCDYRIMASGNYKIGLNETKLGIVAPYWFVNVVKNLIGHRQAEMATELGYLFAPEEALKIGLVDRVVKEDEVLDAAKAEMKRWLDIPNEARVLTKQLLRNEEIQKLLNQQQQDINNFVNFILRESTQKSLGDYMDGLKKGKKT